MNGNKGLQRIVGICGLYNAFGLFVSYLEAHGT